MDYLTHDLSILKCWLRPCWVTVLADFFYVETFRLIEGNKVFSITSVCVGINCLTPTVETKWAARGPCYIESMLRVGSRSPSPPCVSHRQSAVCLIDCVRRLIGRSAGGRISSRAASPPCRFATELHPPGEPLFHVVVSTDQRPAPDPFSIQRLIPQETDGQKACEKTTVFYRAIGLIPYLLYVYIYFL